MDLSFFDPITMHPQFDFVAGLISFANPAVIVPSLVAIHKSERADGQSILMYLGFIMLQTVFALVGAKSDNLGLFISMALSVLLCIVAIGMIAMKRRAPMKN